MQFIESNKKLVILELIESYKYSNSNKNKFWGLGRARHMQHKTLSY